MIEYFNKPVTKYGSFFCFYLDQEDVLKKFEELIDSNVGKLDYKTNIQGQMTTWHHFKNEPFFKDFLKILIPYYDRFKLHEWRKSTAMLSIKDAFAAILEKGGSVDEHTHMGASFSSALYFDDYADLQTDAGTFKTQRGKVITLPGWCSHWVEPIKEDVKRYCLVWNWTPVNEDILERDRLDANQV